MKSYVEKLKDSIKEYKKKGKKEILFYLYKKNNNFHKPYQHNKLFYLHKHRKKKKKQKQEQLFKLNFSKLHHRGEYKLNNI